MNARLSLAGVLGSALVCGAIVAGCSGGAPGSTAPRALATSMTTGAPGSTTSSSKTAPVSISIQIPQRSAATSAKRGVAYVSPATSYVLVSSQPGNINDGQIACSASSCTGVVPVPLTATSLTVTLYNSANQVLSQATQAVSLTPGSATTISFTFDGVAASFPVQAPAGAQLVLGVPTSIPVTITPTDVSGNPLASPGAVTDPSQNVLISPTGSTQTMSLVSSSSAVTASALTWHATSYTLSGNVNYDGTDPGTSQVLLTPTSSVAADGAYNGNALPLAVNPKSIQLIATPTYTIPTLAGQPWYELATPQPSAATTAYVEFAVATAAPVLVSLTLTSNFNNAGVPLTLEPGDGCSNQDTSGAGADGGIIAAFPSPSPVTMPPSLGYTFTFHAASTIGNGACTFTIDDATDGLSAGAYLGFDNTQIFVQGKRRK